jgi:hypothetical protein
MFKKDGEGMMPEKETLERAHQDKEEGKSPSTQAGEFVREEIHHVREGKHGARSPQQAIAIGLSKARRAGVKLPPPAKGKASARTRSKAAQDLRKGESSDKKRISGKRAAAVLSALKREKHSSASTAALSKQASSSARKRGPAARKKAAQKAAHMRQSERKAA